MDSEGHEHKTCFVIVKDLNHVYVWVMYALTININTLMRRIKKMIEIHKIKRPRVALGIDGGQNK